MMGEAIAEDHQPANRYPISRRAASTMSGLINTLNVGAKP
jgi:hypothetical protein